MNSFLLFVLCLILVSRHCSHKMRGEVASHFPEVYIID